MYSNSHSAHIYSQVGESQLDLFESREYGREINNPMITCVPSSIILKVDKLFTEHFRRAAQRQHQHRQR
jgi:hypothetical protein